MLISYGMLRMTKRKKKKRRRKRKKLTICTRKETIFHPTSYKRELTGLLSQQLLSGKTNIAI